MADEVPAVQVSGIIPPLRSGLQAIVIKYGGKKIATKKKQSVEIKIVP